MSTSVPHRRTSSRASVVLSAKDVNRAFECSTTFVRDDVRDKLKMSGWTFPRQGDKSKGSAVGGRPQPNLSSSGKDQSRPLSLHEGSPVQQEVDLVFDHDGSPRLASRPFDRAGMSSPELKAKFHFRPTPLERSDSYHRNESISLAYRGAPSDATAGNALKLLIKKFSDKSPSDLLSSLIFFVCLITFFHALTGTGYQDPVHFPTGLAPRTTRINSASPSPRAWPKIQDVTDDSVDVVIPRSFLAPVATPLTIPNSPDSLEDIPADVHHPEGDSSHDVGAELMRDSPRDHTLDDAHVHHEHTVKKPLFEETWTVVEEVHHPHEPHQEPYQETIEVGELEMEEEMAQEDSFIAKYSEVVIAREEGEDSFSDERHGDTYRRPSGPAGLDQLRTEREAIAKEQSRWLAQVEPVREQARL